MKEPSSNYLEVLWERGRRSFDDLTVPEREQLAAKLVVEQKFQDAWDAIYIPDLPFKFCDFMVTSDKEDLYLLVSEIKDIVVHNQQAQITVLFENLRKNKE